MTSRKAALTVFVAAALAGGPLSTAQVVDGILANGDVIRIDPATGAGALLGHSGAAVATGTTIAVHEGDNSGIGTSWIEQFPFVIGNGSPQASLTWVSPCAGQQTFADTWTVEPAGSSVVAAAGDVLTLGVVYLISQTPTEEILGRLSATYGGSKLFTSIGPTGRGDLVAIALSPAGTLYALGTDNGGALYTVGATTGAATLIAPCAFADARSLAFLADGTLLAAGTSLERINTSTGAVTVIGPTGYADVRALSVNAGCVPSPSNCYVNCDGSWNPPPILNVNDFLCFQLRFVSGDPYANCDRSTVVPYLNVNDFVCFMNRFAGGCS